MARGGFGIGASPVKILLKGTIPALTNISVPSSLIGTSGLLAFRVCPLF